MFFSFSTAQTEKKWRKKLGETRFVWWFDPMSALKECLHLTIFLKFLKKLHAHKKSNDSGNSIWLSKKNVTIALAIDFQGNMKASCQYYASLNSMGTDLQFLHYFGSKLILFWQFDSCSSNLINSLLSNKIMYIT